jgi:hypothetical protein
MGPFSIPKGNFMTTGTVRTQGSELFVIDSVNHTDPTIVKMACPTGITGMGGARDQIEDTCLDTTGDKTFQAGLGNPAQVTVPFNLIPRDTGHQGLFALKEDGSVLHWIACLSEAATDPTLDSDDTFIGPTDRSWFKFDAYVSDVNIDIATNEIVRGTLTLQRSGAVEFFGYEPS